MRYRVLSALLIMILTPALVEALPESGQLDSALWAKDARTLVNVVTGQSPVVFGDSTLVVAESGSLPGVLEFDQGPAPSAASAESNSAPGESNSAPGESNSAPGESNSVSGEAPPPLPPSPAAVAVATATAQIGKPYKYGSPGPNSFDCSGLTSYAWKAAGVGIPRTSRAQFAALPKVPLNAVRPGDLVFSRGHVGMYVGDGQMVHAPQTGKRIQVSPIHKGTYGAARPG